MRPTVRIATYAARDMIRSRWLFIYAGFFFFATFALLRFSDSETKALVGLVNVVLLVVPLANVVFGTVYLYGAREFVELLLAQPIRRVWLYGGLYLGLTLPIAAASFVGMTLPLALQGSDAGVVLAGSLLALIASVLGAVFTALAAVVANLFTDRVRGLAVAVAVWIVLAVIFDGLVLMAAVQFADYPLERPMLAAMFANPVDLARMLMLRQFDAAALLGYTGAAFQRFLGGVTGAFVAAGAVIFWVAAPLLAGARLFHSKDF